MDNYAKCKICICFLGVDKWRNQKNSKHLFTITPKTQKYSAFHLATIPLKPTILSGFKASAPAFPHSITRIKFVPAVPRLHPRIVLSDLAVFSYFTAAASSKITRSPPIWGDGKNYKLSDDFKKPYSYFTSTPSPKTPPPSHLYQKSSHFTYPSPLPPDQPF